MINKRKILALVILLAGVVISVLVLASGNTENGQTKVFSGDSENNPFFEFNTSRNKDSKLALPNEKNDDGKFLDSESDENLTENLINSYTRTIIQEGMSGGFSSEEDAVSKLEENIPSGLNYPQFSEKDIKISPDVSEENQIAYIEAVDEAIWDNFGELKNENTNTAIREFFENKNPDVLNKLIEVTPNYIDDLLQIEVPLNMKEIHLGMLNVWRKKLTIYKAIINQDSDPAKSYLASQDLPAVLQEDQAVQLTLIQRYEELTN
jgi:hypothetical protein